MDYFNAARLAAEGFDGRVQVLDSGQLSMGIGFQVLAAAEAISEGNGLAEVLQIIAGIRQRVRVQALLDTMLYLRRSGRVSWAKAVVGSLLNLKPMIDLRFGMVKRIGQTRTRNQGILRLKQNLQKQEPLERLAVLHTNAENDAMKFLEDLQLKSTKSSNDCKCNHCYWYPCRAQWTRVGARSIDMKTFRLLVHPPASGPMEYGCR